jgi:hypothetical protein
MINLRGKQLNQDKNQGANLEGMITAEELENKTTKIVSDDTGTKSAEELAKQKTIDDAKAIEDAKAVELANKGLEGAKELELDIDGTITKYKIDEKGNAIDSEGKVFKTKEELEVIANSQLQEEPTLVSELITKSGYVIKGEDGKPKVYEDTPEGLLEWNNDVADLKANQAREKFFTENPDILDLYEAKQRGQNLADYVQKKENSWSNTKFDEANEEMLKSVVVSNLLRTGMPKEQAELTAKMYKDTNQLKAFGKIAYEAETKYEKEAIDTEKANFKANQKAEEERTEKHWTSVNETIKSGKLQNISIPESERSDFFTFVSKAVDDNGNSQENLEYHNLTPAQKLEISYLIFKKLDLSKLVTTMARTEQSKSLRLRINGQKGLDKGTVDTRTVNPNNLDISLDNIN